MYLEESVQQAIFKHSPRDKNEIWVLGLILVSFALFCLVMWMATCLCENNNESDYKPRCEACANAKNVIRFRPDLEEAEILCTEV